MVYDFFLCERYSLKNLTVPALIPVAIDPANEVIASFARVM